MSNLKQYIMFNAEEIFNDANDIETRTELFHTWMKNASDSIKSRYALNWRMPHSLFNLSCKLVNSKDIQNIDWFKIYKSKDMGVWENNNKVIV